MQNTQTINTATLRDWLEAGNALNILDVRPLNERAEWYIPGSIHMNAYERLRNKDKDALHGLYLDKNFPVVTVCAGGKTSLIAAELLQEQGFNAFSLKEGMKEWTLAWNTATLSFLNFEIVQVRRTGKGCLSYIISSNNEAIIVDASLPPEVYEQLIKQNKLSLKFVMETHIHADHLSRSKQLAERNKVPLYLPIPNRVKFEFNPIDYDKEFRIGNISIKSISTPGHTLESTSFLIEEKILLTGDTLFINGVGRPDLKADTGETVQKAKLLYQSLQSLLTLNNDIIVLPSHSSQPVDFDKIPIQNTLLAIKKNVAMLQLSEPEFIITVLERIPPTPANYLSIVERNISGDFNGINPIDLEAGANRCAIA